MINKKGQSQIGLVLGLVSGVAFLIIGIIIAFVVVGSLQVKGLIPQTTYTITNESDVSGAGNLAFINMSGYQVNGSTYPFPDSFTIVAVWAEYNQSNGSALSIGGTPAGYNVSLTGANISNIISATGNVSNTTNYVFPNVSISYKFAADNSQNIVARNMTSNFTSGVQNISSKIPTVLLIGAIILILGIMAVLIVLWQRLRMGQGSAL